MTDRPDLPPDDGRIPAASAVILDSRGQLLLVLRGTEPDRGCWSVPGGRLEPGETYPEAAAREALEETGLHVQVHHQLWQIDIPTPDGRTYDVRDYLCTVTGGTLTAGDDAVDARWFAPAELHTLPLTPDLLTYLNRAGLIAQV